MWKAKKTENKTLHFKLFEIQRNGFDISKEIWPEKFLSLHLQAVVIKKVLFLVKHYILEHESEHYQAIKLLQTCQV